MPFKPLPTVKVVRIHRASGRRCIVTFEGDADAIASYVQREVFRDDEGARARYENGDATGVTDSFVLSLTPEEGATRGGRRG